MIRNLVKRSLNLFLGLTAGKVISTIVFVLLARTLLPANFGQVIFFVTILQIATVMADFGLIQWYQSQYQHEMGHNVFQKVLRARVLTSCISAVLAFLFLNFTQTFPLHITVIFTLCLIPEALLSIGDGYYLARQKTNQVALKNPSKMIILFLGFLVTKNFFSLDVAAGMLFLSSFLSACWFFPWRTFTRTRFFNFEESLETLKSSATYGMLLVTSLLYSRGDSLVIQYTLGSTSLGVYGAAYRYLESLALLPTALTQNLFPLTARKGFVSSKQLKKIFLIMLAIGTLLAGGLFVTSEWLTTTILGSNYAAAAPVVRIFAFAVLLFFVNAPLSTTVQSSSMVKKFLPLGIINTVFNILGNIVFVPIYGISAAAWMMVLSEVTGFLINLFFVFRIYQKRD